MIAAYRQCGEDRERLADAPPPLDRSQLRAALSYYQLYPQSIEARLEREEGLDPETLCDEHPFMRPERRS